MSVHTAASVATAGAVVAVNQASAILQRQCACGNHNHGEAECEECTKKRGKRLQRKSTGSSSREIPHIVHDVLHTAGAPLHRNTRTFMESRFARDFSRVRVHSDPQAARSAADVGASAYTVGDNIVFADGYYRPGTPSGDRLLAHELTHVLQEARSGSLSPPNAVSNPGDASEREADAVASRVMDGGFASVHEPPHASLQRELSKGEKIGIGIGIGAGVVGLGLGIAKLAGAFKSKCERIADRVRSHAVYRALVAGTKALADEIIREALKRSNCKYFLEKLLLLFRTPEAPAGDKATANRARVSSAVMEETARLATPDAQAEVGRQEGVADDPTRTWTTRTGRNGKTYLVDASDPKNIVVRIKVRLVAAGSETTAADVSNEVFLEDAIERVAETRGYTVDVVFVDADGPDVFTVDTNVSEWPTSGNLVGNARTLAHEIHHLLGLPDRYDYIEAHAGNRGMLIPSRLHWFREQMRRTADPEGDRSLMGRGTTLLDEDICRVAGLDVTTCAAERATVGD